MRCTRELLTEPSVHRVLNGTQDTNHNANDFVIGAPTPQNSLPPNQTPNAVSDAVTLSEDAGPATVSVLSNDSDPDGRTLTVTAACAVANGTVAVSANGQSVLCTPNANYHGTDAFSYTISDGNGGTATAV